MIRVEHGDMREVLAGMVERGERVQAVVTDPPYHLGAGSHTPTIGHPSWTPTYRSSKTGFMGREWDGGDLAFQSETWRLCFDLLPPGGHLLAFGGTRRFHRLVCAIEDAGFEVRDTIAWIYGSGFPKSRDVSKALDSEAGVEREVIGIAGKSGAARSCMAGDFAGGEYLASAPATAAARQWQGWGTALKPSLELVCVARKPLEGTVASNVLKYGTGALNIDKCRITTGQRPNEDAGWVNDQSLCDSCAERAVQSERQETPATRASIATSDAAQISSAKDQPSQVDIDKPDTGCCDGMPADIIATNSNIAGSGQQSMDLFQQGMTSTMSMATKATIGSKTCSACGVTITSNYIGSITREKKTLQPGGLLPSDPEISDGSIPNGSKEKEHAAEKSIVDFMLRGRWPPNLAHDGSAEVVALFPDSLSCNSPSSAKPEGFILGGARSQGAIYPGESGSAARFFYSSKADAGDRLGSKHPTIKPVDLMRWLVRLVTPPGGTVLDPFAGSGTTGMACMAEGVDRILVEREAEHVADIRRRIAHVHGDDLPLFAQAAD